MALKTPVLFTVHCNRLGNLQYVTRALRSSYINFFFFFFYVWNYNNFKGERILGKEKKGKIIIYPISGQQRTPTRVFNTYDIIDVHSNVQTRDEGKYAAALVDARFVSFTGFESSRRRLYADCKYNLKSFLLWNQNFEDALIILSFRNANIKLLSKEYQKLTSITGSPYIGDVDRKYVTELSLSCNKIC